MNFKTINPMTKYVFNKKKIWKKRKKENRGKLLVEALSMRLTYKNNQLYSDVFVKYYIVAVNQCPIEK